MAMEILKVKASEIEYGDRVMFGDNEFYAWSDAELDQWQDINVSDGNRYRTFQPSYMVTVERNVKVEEYSYNG